MRKTIFSFFILLSFALLGQIPNGYYSTATGTGFTLKTQLHTIIDDHNQQSYSWTFFNATDIDNYYENDGTILDMYSENPTGSDPYNYQVATDQCGNVGAEGTCYNREHSFPASWFNDSYPMFSDVHHLFASDGQVNGRRASYSFGEVGSSTYVSQNGSKLGSARSGLGYSGTVFEPINEFKGDIARIYFYMATRYEDIISGWSSPMLNGTSSQVYTDWAVTMLLAWHTADPVSQKEIDRNNAVYDYQQNRNPFVDHPEYVNAIWGDGTVTPTPTINTTATGGGYNFGTIAAGQSSASVNYKVTGTNLSGNVTVSVSAPFQVSLNNSTWSISVQVTKANAEANTSNTVYVRFSPTTANGQTYTSSITHASSGAASVGVSISGKEGTPGAGFILLTTSSFNSDFGQSNTNTTSVPSSYTVSGADLTANLTITPPAHFQVSLAPTSGFTNSLVLTRTGTSVANTTIYVIFAPTAGGDLSGSISHTAGTATENLAVQGFGVVVSSTSSDLSNIQIYPNPTDGFVEIVGVDWKKTTVRIFDSRGYRLPVRFKEGRIDVSEFQAGMYYFTFSGEGQPVVHKVVIR